MLLTPCRPDELADLLPRALAGEMILAPVDPGAADATLAMLRPELPVTEPDSALVVATSGSTGTPKGVVLSRTALVAASRSAEQLTGPLAWHLALPAHYVAGAMVLVRAAVAGLGVRAVRSDLADLPLPTEPTALSIVPTQLHRALADPELTRRLAAHELVLLGGAAAPPGLVEGARDHGIHVVSTYGMSETCGGCVWDGVPLPGVDVDLDADGRVQLRGDMVFSGYRLRPELTDDVLVDARTVRTNDRGSLDADGRLSILGRLDDIVVSGGVNVDLAAVRRVAAEVAQRTAFAGTTPGSIDVAEPIETAVVGVPDAEWGTRVVLAATDARPLAWWRDALREHFEPPALPRQLVRRDRLPRTSSGKIDQQALVRIAQQEQPRQEHFQQR